MANDFDDGSRRASAPESDPREKPFTPEVLDRTIVALPLLERIKKEGQETVQNVIIDLNLDYPGGRDAAAKVISRLVGDLIGEDRIGPDQGINEPKSRYSRQYLFGRLTGANVQALVRLAREAAKASTSRGSRKRSRDIPPRLAVYKIWLDHEVGRFVTRSVSTVKADAARNAFGAFGAEIVWAVVDTGIDKTHPHFKAHGNLNLDPALLHRDFTALDNNLDDDALCAQALLDPAGHGTHVAGIIAGEIRERDKTLIEAEVRERDEVGEITRRPITFKEISGVAPRCKLLSLKVLDNDGAGLASNLIAALDYVQQLNGNGRRIRVHGINMSVGYDFEPAWFACGQSPLCVEVDRMVRSGVVVVVAGGNTGYAVQNTLARGPVASGLDLTINDPGNAELAITVGSTHRESPHIYGVSYFSSKGPTGDGRLKPDLVAPGEKIISCASTQAVREEGTGEGSGEVTAESTPSRGGKPKPRALYKEDSGTSMAAPHVSGSIAAFLSIRSEFIGRPDEVKRIFLSTATDLGRAVYFQGKGLIDLMRAIQSV
ncbi:S8 family peptidase [Methylobacterium sp. V23]|uniref:S8 family peptidase n=1 Tax=Methylobacterium sp. V23 TaxID=2044878 RepID=UPI001FE1B367|nr:S8 family peptidase [Methylobacterium sp. V23]